MPLAGFLALDQRDRDAVGAEDAGAQIGNRDADAHGSLTGQPGDRHQAAHALRNLVEARAQAIRSVLAVAGDAGIDQARIDRGHRLVADAKPVFDIGTVVFHQHVGARRQLLQDRDAFGRLEVQRHATLVAMHVLEVTVLARTADTFAFVQCGGHLDLDHLRAPIGELTDRGRPGAHAGQIEHRDMRQSGGGLHRVSLYADHAASGHARGGRLFPHYVPVQRGGRLSRKARTPSRKSALP